MTPNLKPDLRLLAAPIVSHSELPKLANSGHEWFQDPVDAETLLYRDEETGYFRSVSKETVREKGVQEGLLWSCDDYGGRQLICPEDCRLGVSEMCHEPGAHYGDWRILDRTNADPRNNSVVGQISTLKEPLAELIGKPLPEPVPYPESKGEPAILSLAYGCTGLVYPRHCELDDIWTEDYLVVVVDSWIEERCVIFVGEDQSKLIRLRDRPEYFLARLRDAGVELAGQAVDAERAPIGAIRRRLPEFCPFSPF